jgi:hypothetical protein
MVIQRRTFGRNSLHIWKDPFFFLLNPFGIVVCCNLFLGPRTKKGENIKKNQSKNIAGKEDAREPRK